MGAEPRPGLREGNPPSAHPRLGRGRGLPTPVFRRPMGRLNHSAEPLRPSAGGSVVAFYTELVLGLAVMLARARWLV
ncbi:hypothetical protein T492DRAFT_941181 [Pavlovales sp. CCMP2436]|nr:hypothetical protein T492DRAFT_941181 [Pavlovales sp. CCMP2436]